MDIELSDAFIQQLQETLSLYVLGAEYEHSQFTEDENGRRYLKAGEKPVCYVLADDSVVMSKWQYPRLNVVFATETLEEMALKIQVVGIELEKIIYDEYPLMSQEQIQRFEELMGKSKVHLASVRKLLKC